MTISLKQMDRKAFEAMLAETLPKGTSKDEVIAFLDKYGIEHSRWLAASNSIKAILRHRKGWLVVERVLEMEFYFDQKARLDSFTIKEGFTGP